MRLEPQAAHTVKKGSKGTVAGQGEGAFTPQLQYLTRDMPLSCAPLMMTPLKRVGNKAESSRNYISKSNV